MMGSSYAPDLAAARELLGQARTRIEAGFLAVGDKLALAVERIGALRCSLAALPDELAGPDIVQAGADLGRAADIIGGMTRDLATERDGLACLAAVCGELGKSVDRLSRTMSQVGVLAVNARIVAASLSADGTDFTVFTSEIGRLALHAKRSVERLADAQRDVASLLLAARRRHGEFATRQGAMLQDAAERLTATLATVEVRRIAALDGMQSIAARSQQIGAGISRAVEGLQVGDIARQRIEHVDEALTALLAATGPHGTIDPALHDAVATEVARLQSAQLGVLLEEFRQESDRAGLAVDDIAGETAAMLRLSETIYGGSGGSFLGELAGQVRDAGSLLAACETGRAEVDAAAATLRDRLQQIGAEVGLIADLEADMRLLGLNAALRCGRLGNAGRVLNVVAQELRAYGRRTVEDAQAVMATLRRLSEASRALDTMLESHNAAGIAAMQAETEKSVHRLGSVEASLARALGLVQREGAEISALLRGAAVAMAEPDRIGACAHAAHARLARITDAAPAGGYPPVAADIMAVVLRDRYTMASERAVHHHVLADSVGRRTEAATQAATIDDALEDILF